MIFGFRFLPSIARSKSFTEAPALVQSLTSGNFSGTAASGVNRTRYGLTLETSEIEILDGLLHGC